MFWKMNSQNNLPLKNKWVSDLTWVISSPSLLENQKGTNKSLILGTKWHEARYNESIQWLCDLDEDPTPLNEWMDSSKDKRIGSLFERLITFWLKFGPGPLRLIKNGLQIIENKHTLGELDFIVFNEEENEFWSIEVAVKFYIGVNKSYEMKDFVGPRVMDTLRRKWNHLIEKQSRLHKNPVAQKAILNLTEGRQVIPKIYIKGRLFVPFEIFQKHSTNQIPLALEQDYSGLCGGWWMTPEKADAYFKKSQVCELNKSFYFSPISEALFEKSDSPFKQEFDFNRIFHDEKNIPRLIAVADKTSGVEESRGWIVPSGWPDCIEEIEADER